MSTYADIDSARNSKLSQDHKRERDHKYKWAHGEAEITRGRLSRRPAKMSSVGSVTRAPKPAFTVGCDNDAFIIRVHQKYNPSFKNGTSTSSSSAEEDVIEASAAPDPEAGISYSFDAPRGPQQGSQILGMALAKAVEKYEFRATETLIKEEYEFVKKNESLDGYSADDDDFEFV